MATSTAIQPSLAAVSIELDHPPYAIFHNGHFLKSNGVTFQGHSKIILNKNFEFPVVLIYLTDDEYRDHNIHVEVEIEVAQNIQATLIEYHTHSREMDGMMQFRTTLQLNSNAKLNHFILKQGDNKEYHQAVEIFQSEMSEYEATHIALQGLLNKSTALVHLNGTAAKSTFHALMFSNQKNKTEVDLVFNHHAPECHSHCTARTVLHDQSKAKFSGKIIVHPKAHHTSAHLENKCILLSEEAEMTTKPEFEIYHDDVRCTHGATVGSLDPEALFYLKSRGIEEKEAKRLLITAFLQPVLKPLDSKIFAPFVQKLQELFS